MALAGVCKLLSKLLNHRLVYCIAAEGSCIGGRDTYVSLVMDTDSHKAIWGPPQVTFSLGGWPGGFSEPFLGAELPRPFGTRTRRIHVFRNSQFLKFCTSQKKQLRPV